MTAPNTLSTDFDLMRSVANTTDIRNDEIRATLQAFIGRMSCVPPSVWGGPAAARFKDVVDRWNAESLRLYQILHAIADTIRHNEATLREAGLSESALGGALGAPTVDLDEQLDAVRLCGMVGLPGAPRNRSSPHARTPLRGSPGGGVVL